MLSNNYVLVKNKYYFPNQTLVSYGIAIVDNDKPAAAVIRTIANISFKKNDVLKLINLCNKAKVEPDEIDDFIEECL